MLAKLLNQLNIRTRLFLLCLTVAMPLLMLSGLAIWKEYQTLKNEARRATTFQAAIVTRTLSHWIASQKDELKAIASLPGLADDRLHLSAPKVQVESQSKAASSRVKVLSSLVKARSSWQRLSLFDVSGQLLATSSAGNIAAGNIADEPFFKDIVAKSTPSISGYCLCPVSGKPALLAGAPVYKPGRPQMVLVASIEPHAVLSLFKGLGEQNGSVIVVVDENTRVLARTLNNDHWLGKDYSKAKTVKAAHKSWRGTLEAVGIADPIARAYAFDRLPLTDWLVIVGVPLHTIFGPAQDRLLIMLLLTICAFGLSLTIAYSATQHFTGPINELVKEAIAIGRGDLGSRVAVVSSDELGLLARAFNQMASKLQFNQEQELLTNHIVRSVRSSLELDTILNTVSRELGEALLADRCQIAQPKAQGPLVITHEYHRPEYQPMKGTDLYSLSGTGNPPSPELDLDVDRTSSTRAPLFGIDLSVLITGDTTLKEVPIAAIYDVSSDARAYAFREFLMLDETRSLIAAPLLDNNRLMGVLLVHQCRQYRPWKPAEVGLVAAIADQVSVAISHARLFDQVRHQAVTDGLTELYNHVYLKKRLTEELRRAQRKGTSCSLLMIDLDKLKDINDTCGHPVGDAAIRQVSFTLRNTLRSGDTAARYGGEEFAVILPDTSIKEAALIAERLCQQVNSRPVGGVGNISVSIGAAAFPNQALGLEELVDKADQALYKAKHGGRNQVCIWQPEWQTDGSSPSRQAKS